MGEKERRKKKNMRDVQAAVNIVVAVCCGSVEDGHVPSFWVTKPKRAAEGKTFGIRKKKKIRQRMS